MQIAAVVFEIGGGAAHGAMSRLSNSAMVSPVQEVGHRHADTVDMAQSGGPGLKLMMMGIQGQHGENLARAQANTDIDHPDEAIGKGGLVQGQAPQGTGRVDAHDGEPDHPIDDGLRTRRLLDAKRQRQKS